MTAQTIENRVNDNKPMALSAYGVLTGTTKMSDEEYAVVHDWINETRAALNIPREEHLAPKLHDALVALDAIPGD